MTQIKKTGLLGRFMGEPTRLSRATPVKTPPAPLPKDQWVLARLLKAASEKRNG